MFFNLLKTKRMKKRKDIRCVCRCTPREGIVAMDAKLLTDMVESERRRIGARDNLRMASQMSMWLGDVCDASGHGGLAIDVWSEGLSRLEWEDQEWVTVPINTRLFRFNNLVSKDEACELGRRIDRTWRRLGHREMAHYAARARQYYKDLWLEKYCEALP